MIVRKFYAFMHLGQPVAHLGEQLHRGVRHRDGRQQHGRLAHLLEDERQREPSLPTDCHACARTRMSSSLALLICTSYTHLWTWSCGWERLGAYSTFAPTMTRRVA